jgi:hypothetical protein
MDDVGCKGGIVKCGKKSKEAEKIKKYICMLCENLKFEM